MAVSSGQNASTRGKVGQTDNQVDGFGDGAGTWKARGGVKKNGPNGEGAGQNNDLAAIQAIFQGMQQNMPTPEGVRRPMIRRGMSGAILDENGQDPGSGFNVFQRNNPHLATQAQRQAQFEREQNTLAQQRQAAGANAVDFAKQTRGFTDANGNFVKPTLPSDSLFKPIGGGASSVTGSDGYKSVFDQNGRAVGTNRPIGGPQDKGMWDITSTNPRNPNLGQQIQDNAFGPTSRKGGVPAMPPASSSSSNNDPMLSSVFGGNGAKPATPQPQTYSDGKTLGQRELERRKGGSAPAGAAPYNEEQLSAMSKLFKPGSSTPMSRMSFDFSDLYPGNDFAHLNNIFPGGMDYDGMIQILKDPATRAKVLSQVPPAPEKFQWVK